MWKYFNPHPQGKLVGDCFLRAIAKAEGITWDTALFKLDETRRYNCCLYTNETENIKEFLLSNGYYYHKIEKDADFFIDKHMSVREISALAKDTPIIIFCAPNKWAAENHAVCAVDGNYYDTWDSGGYLGFGYFSKEAPDYCI